MLIGLSEMNDKIDIPAPAHEHYASGSQIKLTKEQALALRKSLAEIGPMLLKAQEELLRLPLRPILDPKTMLPVFVRFATAQELQRILMRHTLGRVIVDVLPVSTGTDSVVSARLSVATNEGYVQMPTINFASQTSGLGGRDLGHKQLLSAESRSIRRVLREIGLRAEYEDDASEQETMEAERSKHDDAIQKQNNADEPAMDDADDSADNAKLSEQDLDDEDIPSMNSSKHGQVELPLAPAKSPRQKRPQKASKVAAIATAKAPKKELELELNYEHKAWPDRRGTDYTHNLLQGLNEIRKSKGYTVEDLAKLVFGEGHVAQKRLTSYMTKELQKMYQFHVIQGGKV